MTSDDCSGVTIRHCLPLLATIRTIRDHSHYSGLFAVRDYSLFAIWVFQTPEGIDMVPKALHTSGRVQRVEIRMIGPVVEIKVLIRSLLRHFC